MTVALVPDQNRGRANAYYYKASDLAGAFKFTGVAPGNYKIFAWERVEWGAWRNAEFLRGVEDRGVPVRVDANATANVTVRVIQ